MTTLELPNIEHQYVLETYSHIFDKFSHTRHYVWEGVKNFINMVESKSTLFEAGCGNGKNLAYRSDITPIGCDICKKFVDICLKKNIDASVQSVTNMSYPSNSFDNTICIAVIHHLSTDDRRIMAIKELLRVTKSGGRIFLEVWAHEQSIKNTKKNITVLSDQDIFVPFNKQNDTYNNRYYHMFKKGELEKILNVIDIPHKIIDNFYEKDNWCVILQKL